MDRRAFLERTGLTFAAAALAQLPGKGAAKADATATPQAQAQAQSTDWASVRGMFSLDPALLHFGGLYLASHPAPVQQAIDAHRRALDSNPVEYLHAQGPALEAAVLRAAAGYLGGSAADIALTDSTTMGLGLLYSGLGLRPDQEVVTTQHDFYATHAALRLAALRTGASVRQIAVYRSVQSVTADEIVASVEQALSERTRVLALTWVHSSTGLKLPLRRIAEVVWAVNTRRAPSERALVCVDGVHGFGVEDVAVADLGVDFFVSGCHKWLLGPRGTGLVWGRGADAWSAVTPTIPTFGDGQTYGSLNTPGGFHSFEHRWALSAAFDLHQQIGRSAIAERIHALSGALKAGLAALTRVRLITPMDDELSAGLVCFEVAGLAPQAVVDQLRARNIVATVTPYATAYARLAPGVFNTQAEIESVVREVAAL